MNTLAEAYQCRDGQVFARRSEALRHDRQLQAEDIAEHFKLPKSAVIHLLHDVPGFLHDFATLLRIHQDYTDAVNVLDETGDIAEEIPF